MPIKVKTARQDIQRAHTRRESGSYQQVSEGTVGGGDAS